MNKGYNEKVLFIREIIENDRESTEVNHIAPLKVQGVFITFFEPIINYFGDNLDYFIGIQKLNNLPTIENDLILNSAVENFSSELIGICMKALITDMHEHKNAGLLEGDTSEARYESYERRFEDKAEIIRILEKYPVLVHLIYVKIMTKLDLVTESLKNYGADVETLKDTLNIGSGKIAKLDISAGDSHNGGKSVVIFELEGGKKVVYKPHVMSPEQRFNELTEWMNSKDELKLKLRQPSVVNKGNHGWQEYIEYAQCHSEQEAKDYFYRIGSLLSILHIIKADDIHQENIIAHGAYPMIIDMETMLNNEKVAHITEENLPVTFFREIGDSVLGTMLLPAKFANTKIDWDLSGLSGDGGTKSESIVYFKLINHGTDNLRFKPDFIVSQENSNRVKLEDKKLNAIEYQMDIEEGFKATYEFFMKHKDEFIQRIEEQECLNGTYRQVLRTTHAYGRFLEASIHPKYLGSMESRRALFEGFYDDAITDERFSRRVSMEINDLMDNDIPYFIVEFDSNKLLGSGVQEEENYFDRTIKELTIQRLNKISPLGLKRQLSYIKMSLMTLKDEAWQDGQKSTKAIEGGHKVLETEGDYLQGAIEIGEYYLERAIWNKERDACTWVNLTFADDQSFILGHSSHTLYEGGGNILFLAQLGKASGLSKFEELAKAGLAGLEAMNPKEQFENEEQYNVSLFSGMGSLIYLYFNLGYLWNDNDLIEKGNEVIKYLDIEKISNTNTLDIIGGLAGTLIALCNIYEQTQSTEILNSIRNLSDEFYKQVLGQMKGSEILNGYAHGYAGLALASAKVGHVLEDEMFLGFSAQLMEEENKHYNTVTGNWNDLREESQDSDLMYWCHGAPGIGLSRSLMKEYMTKENQDIIDSDIERVKEKLFDKGYSKDLDHSMCHGAFGNIDMMLQIAAKEDDEALKAFAYECGEKALKDAYDNGFRYGLGDAKEITTFMLGLSGIGYGLLRLSDPRIPSILAIDTIGRKETQHEIQDEKASTVS